MLQSDMKAFSNYANNGDWERAGKAYADICQLALGDFPAIQ